MIKPSKQTKHPAEAERMNKDKGPKFQLEVQKFKVGHKGAKEQIMFPCLHQSLHHSQEAYQKEMEENLKVVSLWNPHM